MNANQIAASTSIWFPNISHNRSMDHWHSWYTLFNCRRGLVNVHSSINRNPTHHFQTILRFRRLSTYSYKSPAPRWAETTAEFSLRSSSSASRRRKSFGEHAVLRKGRLDLTSQSAGGVAWRAGGCWHLCFRAVTEYSQKLPWRFLCASLSQPKKPCLDFPDAFRAILE